MENFGTKPKSFHIENYDRIPRDDTPRGPSLMKTLPRHTKLFQNSSSSSSQSSCSSDLSLPFLHLVYDKRVESLERTKTLYGKDFYAAFYFSDDFRKAIESVKVDNIAVEPKDQATSPPVSSPLIEYSPRRKLPQFLDWDFQPEVEPEPEANSEEGQKRRKNEEGSRTRHSSEEDSLFDSMSGYWRMLSVYEKFTISPPWYDAYGEGKRHWMETKVVPPEVLENSRVKCLNWLNNYFEKV